MNTASSFNLSQQPAYAVAMHLRAQAGVAAAKAGRHEEALETYEKLFQRLQGKRTLQTRHGLQLTANPINHAVGAACPAQALQTSSSQHCARCSPDAVNPRLQRITSVTQSCSSHTPIRRPAIWRWANMHKPFRCGPLCDLTDSVTDSVQANQDSTLTCLRQHRCI